VSDDTWTEALDTVRLLRTHWPIWLYGVAAAHKLTHRLYRVIWEVRLLSWVRGDDASKCMLRKTLGCQATSQCVGVEIPDWCPRAQSSTTLRARAKALSEALSKRLSLRCDHQSSSSFIFYLTERHHILPQIFHRV
jgi:hypothetical protein